MQIRRRIRVACLCGTGPVQGFFFLNTIGHVNSFNFLRCLFLPSVDSDVALHRRGERRRGGDRAETDVPFESSSEPCRLGALLRRGGRAALLI